MSDQILNKFSKLRLFFDFLVWYVVQQDAEESSFQSLQASQRYTYRVLQTI